MTTPTTWHTVTNTNLGVCSVCAEKQSHFEGLRPLPMQDVMMALCDAAPRCRWAMRSGRAMVRSGIADVDWGRRLNRHKVLVTCSTDADFERFSDSVQII